MGKSKLIGVWESDEYILEFEADGVGLNILTENFDKIIAFTKNTSILEIEKVLVALGFKKVEEI